MSNELLRKKAEAFSDQKLEVHVMFKQGFWMNGNIENVSEDFFVLNEFKKGKTPVFYAEILDLEKYTKPRRKLA